METGRVEGVQSQGIRRCWSIKGEVRLEREAWECPGGKKTVGFCVVTWRTGGWGGREAVVASGVLKDAPEPDPWTGRGLALGGPTSRAVRRSF